MEIISRQVKKVELEQKSGRFEVREVVKTAGMSTPYLFPFPQTKFLEETPYNSYGLICQWSPCAPPHEWLAVRNHELHDHKMNTASICDSGTIECYCNRWGMFTCKIVCWYFGENQWKNMLVKRITPRDAHNPPFTMTSEVFGTATLVRIMTISRYKMTSEINLCIPGPSSTSKGLGMLVL